MNVFNASTFLVFLVLMLAWPAVGRSGASEPQPGAAKPLPMVVEFNRDIRPILSDNCFQCHGPDDQAREADLRLDEPIQLGDEQRLSDGVIAHNAEASELIVRILSEDADARMPPLSTNKRLTEREINLLRLWIDQGASYQTHWSFLPLQIAHPPDNDSVWAKNPLDQFVLARIQEQQLAPSPAANPRTLIKRLYLDLVGLLPDPQAVEAFVVAYDADQDGAVRTLARELLDNPHHGERWGRHWLDQARYADSHGYTIDGDRIMWPYRDWVIAAINADMPFDQFTIEQLAGDLLPDADKAQQIATGFHRNTLVNQEGGTDAEQFRNEEVVDRVNTTGAVWLGLTLGCAQCHSHKFDPISQQEYFQFFAFFNHTADVNNIGPTVMVSEGELLLAPIDPVLQIALDDAQDELDQVKRSTSLRRAAWEKSMLLEEPASRTTPWKSVPASELSAAGGAALQRLDGNSILAGVGAAKETYTVRLGPIDEPVAALRLRVLPHESLPKSGPGRASNGNFVLSDVNIRSGEQDMVIARVQADHEQPGYPLVSAIDHDPKTGWAINVGKGSRAGVRMNAEHQAQFVFDKPVNLKTGFLTVVLAHEVNDHYNIGHFAFDVTTLSPASIFDQQLIAAVRVAADQRSDEQRKLVATEFEKSDQPRRDAESKVEAIRKKMGLGKPVASMVMRELADPRPTFIHIRGNFLRIDEETGPLQAAVPKALPPLATDAPQPNRLDLARWLVDKDNPLTARVTVNRVWMHYFGSGLVETENDFGTQGSFPTHPKLLDWLAWQFIESGWSMKNLHELIVTSATYRQASHHRPELDHVDPLNRLLARQNRIRVDAEIIRDAALSASGLLNPRIGGPSVRPPQPDGIYAFTQTKKSWTADTNENRFRRALYTRFYRSAPYPMLTTFDAPDFQSTCTRRARSNTPLQSLTMANDQAIFELAQGLAVRLLRSIEGSDDTANRKRVRQAFLICYCRPPNSGELDAVITFQKSQAIQFKDDPNAAGKVAPARYPKSYPVEISASWTAVARAMMNTDEFVTRE